MSDCELKGAIIGAGYFAGFQAEAWNRIREAKVVAVVDPVEERAREFAARWRIPRVYADAETMLQNEKPDFVDIATRPATHLPLVRLAAAHGAQVICQKPMAATWDECTAMVEACREANVRLFIHENWRWQPWYREIKRLLDRGVFGEVFHAGFMMRSGDGRGPEPYTVQPYFRQMERLIVYEMLVHFLDTFRFLMGEIESVYCRTKRLNPVLAGEDYALIHLRFESGADGLIDANRFSGSVPPEVAFGSFTLEGARAAIRMTPQGDLFLTEYGQEPSRHEYEKTEQGYKGDSVKATQEHILSCLLNGQRCESEGDDYLKTVAAVFACYRSAETGQVIQLNTVRGGTLW
jgi:predicted dehydrogenase